MLQALRTSTFLLETPGTARWLAKLLDEPFAFLVDWMDWYTSQGGVDVPWAMALSIRLQTPVGEKLAG